MASLRQIIDGTRFHSIAAFGTSEGVTKSWDTRGRGRKESVTTLDELKKRDKSVDGDCTGKDCGELQELRPTSHTHTDDTESHPPVVVPHLDNLEFMMTSHKKGYNVHFDKEALKTMLKMALVQLDAEDSQIRYLNTPQGLTTDHYANIKFGRHSQNIHGSRSKRRRPRR